MRCIGFGQHEGNCENEAGTERTAHWCQRCDDMRIDHISKRFDEMEKRMKDNLREEWNGARN